MRRLLSAALAVGAAGLASCAGDRSASAVPFNGTWIQVRGTSPEGDRVLDSSQIGMVSLTADQVVVALAGERRVIAVPVAASGSDGAGCGTLDLGDGRRVIVTSGEGMVERSIEGVHLGMPARYLDIEVSPAADAGPAMRARVWSAAALRPPVVIAVEPPAPASRAAVAASPALVAPAAQAAPAQAASAAPSAAPSGTDAAFIAAGAQVEPGLAYAAAVIVELAREHGVRSEEVARERWRDADLVRRRQLELLMKARHADGPAARALLREASRLDRAVAEFEAAYAAWSDARA